ncbi:MAG: hypothetical protein HN704_06490 [Bacteroidetes bacterium]|nr:hypothetical protein [Bacteroidota bacterium]MBT6686170.1 hypothetical protein [Bacteroidota bacterium]MBT7491236.1 hypothetical protein [Bacteroidota bacterium]
MKILLFAIVFLAAFTIKAQEIQVSMDEEGKVELIDSKLEKKIRLFSEYKGMIEARLFQSSDTTYVLEILYQPADKLLKIRKPLLQEQVQDFRKMVTASIQQQAPEIAINQEGRTKLLISTSIHSLGYYGWTVPNVLQIENNKAFVGLYMLTSGAGFYIPFALTKKIRVTDADASLSIYGQSRGIGHGVFLTLLFDENASEQAVLAMGMLASLAEGIGGYVWADRTKMTAGSASAIGVMGDFGIVIGLGTAHITGFFDDFNVSKLSASILLGSAAGITSGVLLAGNQSYTKGDAYVLRSAGTLGAYVSLTAAIIAEPNNEKSYTAALTFGSIGGIAIGHALTKGHDFTTGQGVLISLSELAGGLIGLGTGYLISSDSDDSYKLFITTSALGAVGGFALMTNYYSKKAHVETKDFALNFNINPHGLLGLAKGNKYNINKMPMPVFSAILSF